MKIKERVVELVSWFPHACALLVLSIVFATAQNLATMSRAHAAPPPPDPIRMGCVFDLSASTADVFSEVGGFDLRLARTVNASYVGRTTSALRIGVCIASGQTDRSVYLAITRLADGNVQLVRLGSGDLADGDGYTFSWPADPAYGYNLRMSGATRLAWASLEESQNDGL
jgi:hypothetical protein